MRKYRISPGLKKYVRKVLIRCFYSCRMEQEDGCWWCYTNASSDTFHRIVQRARCEKVSDETGTFYVTYSEAKDTLLMPLLLEQAKTNSYQIITDREKEI